MGFTPGKDGALTVSSANTVVNQYAVLSANLAAGATSMTVTGLAANLPGLSTGDLLMIYQAQGATITSTNDYTYGTVSALNNAGRYELVSVVSVDNANNTIVFEGCSNFGAQYSYTASGNAQVIKVPQYTSLTVNAASSIVPNAWNGATGGVVAIHVAGTTTITGSINASERGFRGGIAVNAAAPTDIVSYVDPSPDNGAEKGESIAGPQTSYPGGRYQRGAAANGGGGGNSHDNAGGGGANGNNGNPWTVGSPATRGGQGVMPASGPEGAGGTPPYNWTVPWSLDPGYVANGNALTNSSGGGRGGYAWGDDDGNELTQGPGNAAWAGDNRREAGGLGGRPLNNDPSGRVFMGGGGGAGHMNNRAAEPNTDGDGGNGGGIVFLISNTVSGSGTIVSNGAIGGKTQTSNPNDAPGGGGAGGTVIVRANTLANTLTINANGGRGGIQPYDQNSDESEGGGGGGGGGYIAVSGGAPTRTANGGLYGYTTSRSVPLFQPNGGTSGATGQATASATTVPFCHSWVTGRVFNDANGNGTLDGGEVGIPNVTVTIVSANGPGYPDVVTTDANGFYAIEVYAGPVTATVDGSDPDLGVSPVLTTSNAVQSGLAFSSTGYQTAPVGYRQSSTINGTVYNDANRNGTLQAGEAGYSGIPVTLIWAGPNGTFGNGDDVVIGPQNTAANGTYNFTGLTPGNYRITVTTAGLPAGSTLTSGTNPRDITVTSGQTSTQDFGYANSALAITKTSNAPNPLPVGTTVTYTVSVSNPSGSTVNAVTLSDPLPSGTTYVANSISVTAPTTIPGTSGNYADNFGTNSYGNNDGSLNFAGNWTEVNDNGSATTGDTLVTGGFLRIGDDDDQVIRTFDLSGVTTATLSFQARNEGFESNDDFIIEVRPTNSGTWLVAASFDGDSPTDSNSLEPVGTGGAFTSIGPINLLAISGMGSPTANAQVRFRMDGNFSNDDVAIDNVNIQITRAATRGNATVNGGTLPNLTANFITANGAISLQAGESMTATYQVTVNNSQTPGVTGITNTATASSSSTASVSASVTDTLRGTISGHVFRDDDGNGVQNGGEPNLANIDVVITTSAGGTVTVSTDGSGNYTANVPAGTTTANVRETDPDMPAASVLTTGNDPQTVFVNAGSGATATTPVGYRSESAYVVRVFQDLNQDGVQQPGEPFLPRITVFVTLSNGQVLTLSTDAAGIVRAILPPGATVADVNQNDGTLPPEGADVTTGNDPQPFSVTAGSFIVGSPFGLFFDGPLFVALDYFRARVEEGTNIVFLEWKTSLEESNAGFHIWRAIGTTDPARMTAQLIPGLGDSLEGAEYTWSDMQSLAPGEVRSYFLVDLEFDGTTTWHGPVTVEGNLPLSAIDDWSAY